MSSRSRSPSLVSMSSSTLSTSAEDFKLDPAPKDLIAHAERMIPSGPVDGSRSCLQTDQALEEWAEFQAWKKKHGDLQATSTERPSDPCSDHERFFLPAQNIFFLVSRTFYSVPRAPFEWHSSAFTGKGLSKEDPFILDDIKAAHFDNFLSILYPYAYGVYTASTVEEWTAILHLANEWRFESIKTLAIKHLAAIANDIDKIILGRQYTIDEWLSDAYLAICMREQSLTEEEGTRMQVADIIKINSIRQQFGLGAQLKVADPVLVAEVCMRFGLAAPGATIGSSLPLASEECKVVSSAHVDGGNMAPLRNGMDAVMPTQEAVMLTHEPGFEARSKAAAELRVAQRAKQRDLTDRALKVYPSTTSIPYSTAYNGAVNSIKSEQYRQDLLSFIADFISENSPSASP